MGVKDTFQRKREVLKVSIFIFLRQVLWCNVKQQYKGIRRDLTLSKSLKVTKNIVTSKKSHDQDIKRLKENKPTRLQQEYQSLTNI